MFQLFGFMIYLIIALSISIASAQQTLNSTRAKVRAYRQANEHKIMRELMELLAIPNLASDSINIRRNAAKLVEMLERRGIRTQWLEAPGAPPVVFGELHTPSAKRTLILYAHYDGQPVDASNWANDPWLPVLRNKATEADGRIIPLPLPGSAIDGDAVAGCW